LQITYVKIYRTVSYRYLPICLHPYTQNNKLGTGHIAITILSPSQLRMDLSNLDLTQYIVLIGPA